MKKVKEKQENKQMELGLKSPFFNILFNLKAKARNLLLYFEAAKYFKDFLNWLYIVLVVCLIATQVYFAIKAYAQLPSQIPLFSYFNQLEKRLVTKEFLIALPVVSAIMLFVSGRFSYKYFHKERALARLLLLIMLLSISLITMLSLKISLPYYG